MAEKAYTRTDPFAVLKRNRAEALDLATKTGQVRMRALLQGAETDLVKRLADARASRANTAKGGSFTAAQLEMTLRQVRDVTKGLTKGMRGLVLDQASVAADKAAGNMLEYMSAAHRKFRGIADAPLPIKEAAVLDRAVQGARASALRRLSTSGQPDAAPENAREHRGKEGVLERYGMRTVETFEQTLQQGMLTKKSWGDMASDLTAQSPFLQQAPAYWADRIVRCETMGAYNRAGWEAIRASDDVLGDMVKILSAVFDERTGWDSYQVHGQIRRPDEPFEWADGLYMAPPNRPNDREVVVPHRVSWPIPEYLKWRDDDEVMARYKMQRKKGSPGPRPKMTTVELDRFGKAK